MELDKLSSMLPSVSHLLISQIMFADRLSNKMYLDFQFGSQFVLNLVLISFYRTVSSIFKVEIYSCSAPLNKNNV